MRAMRVPYWLLAVRLTCATLLAAGALVAGTACGKQLARAAPASSPQSANDAFPRRESTATQTRPVTGTSALALRPKIVWDPIPFPASRKREMAAYARRHYGLGTYRLTDPRVIVEHYTETPDFASTYNTFAPDHPDSELHELPNTCVHFVVDRDGTIRQLVPLTIMCRHTVGLNYTAIGIEHVGYSDGEIMRDRSELRASLALTRWLRCRYGIAVGNVIGHSESVRSPYHHENVASLRTQTHSDWLAQDMNIYRAHLRRVPCGSMAHA